MVEEVSAKILAWPSQEIELTNAVKFPHFKCSIRNRRTISLCMGIGTKYCAINNTFSALSSYREKKKLVFLPSSLLVSQTLISRTVCIVVSSRCFWQFGRPNARQLALKQ